ncbi:MAG TPA: lytic murein transglycosylase [Gemmatimonadales bacterium]|nr:lytic murein transglycosylase [Gemmatimonadales bacterium]
MFASTLGDADHHHAVPPRRAIIWLALAVGVLLPAIAGAQASTESWSYLIDRLVADGIDRERATHLFADPRVPPFTGLEFSLGTHEPRALYRPLLRPRSIAAARRCRAEHAASFEAAQRATGVPASVIAAILHIETGCGAYTGSNPVVYRLARLAMADEPANLQANIDRLAGSDPELVPRVRARARNLTDTFYPEVRAVFELGDRLGVDPLILRGSTSGAFGLPQFLPTSYLRYGTDANGDGRIDLFDVDDAAASCARYLAAEGWRRGCSPATQRAVIRQYNHSDAYVAAVLTIARAIDGSHASVVAVAKKGPARQRATSHRRPGGRARSRHA